MDEESDQANNNNVANNVENEAGVQQVSEVGDNDEITTPPDNIIEKEIQAIEISKCKSKASTSSSNIKASRVHIQDPKAKHLTPAAKMHEELNMSLLSLMQKDQKYENPVEDETDLAFASIATHMHIHMNRDQREDLIQQIERLTTNAINNVWKGIPVLQPGPGMRAPGGYVLPMTEPPQAGQNVMPGTVALPDQPALQMQPQVVQHPVNEVDGQSSLEGPPSGNAFYTDISYNTPGQYTFPDMS